MIETEQFGEDPQKICTTTLISSGQTMLRSLDERAIEQQFIKQYKNYHRKKLEHSFGQRLRRQVNKIVVTILIVLHQIWRQIIPEIFRGRMIRRNIDISQSFNETDNQFFVQYRKKKNPFFLIVFGEGYSQQDMQVAYQKASQVITDGFGITSHELRQKTHCQTWSINIHKANKFKINFLKHNIFGELVWFGSISREMLVQNEEKEDFVQNFKESLMDILKGYQDIEKSFLGSYIQKEDRNQFTL